MYVYACVFTTIERSFGLEILRLEAGWLAVANGQATELTLAAVLCAALRFAVYRRRKKGDERSDSDNLISINRSSLKNTNSRVTQAEVKRLSRQVFFPSSSLFFRRPFQSKVKKTARCQQQILSRAIMCSFCLLMSASRGCEHRLSSGINLMPTFGLLVVFYRVRFVRHQNDGAILIE